MADFKNITRDNYLTCVECGSVDTYTEDTDVQDHKVAHCNNCDATGLVRYIGGMTPRMAVDTDSFALLSKSGVKTIQNSMGA